MTQLVPDEDHSTGTAWSDRLPQPAGLPEHIRPWRPDEQRRHLADLLEGLAGYAVGRPMQRTTAAQPPTQVEGAQL